MIRLILAMGEKLTPDEVLSKANQGDMFGALAAKPVQQALAPTAQRTRSTQYYVGPRGGKWADPEHTIPWSGEGGGVQGQTTIEAPGVQDTTQVQHENPVLLDIAARQEKAFTRYARAATEARDAGDKKIEAGAWAQAEKAARNLVGVHTKLGGASGKREAVAWDKYAARATRKKEAAFEAAEGPQDSYFEHQDAMKESYRRQRETSMAAKEARKSDAFAALADFAKAMYIGPRGGKWSDPERTIPYKEPGRRLGTAKFKREMDRRRAEGCVVSGPATYRYKEIIKAAGGVWDSWEKQWLVPTRELANKLNGYMARGGKITGSTAASQPERPAEEKAAIDLPGAGVLNDAQLAHQLAGQKAPTKADIENLVQAINSVKSVVGPSPVYGTGVGALGVGTLESGGKLTPDGEQAVAKLTQIEVSILIDACHAVAVREPIRRLRAEHELDAKRAKRKQELERQDKRDLAAGKLMTACGEGYGGHSYLEGEVLELKGSGLVTVVSASEKYVKEDGLTFGVGAESGYIFSAKVRKATKAETKEYLEAKAARELVRTQYARVAGIGREIQKKGRMPPGDNVIVGEIHFESSVDLRLYGGGSWFVIEPDGETLWYVQNNGGDGDMWEYNNVSTGGAGALGWRVKDKALVDEIKALSGDLKGRSE